MKKFLLLILLIGMALQPVLAAQQPPPYPTNFALIGTLNKGDSPAQDKPEGYKVVFYKDKDNSYQNGYATCITDANGKIDLNAHADIRLLPLAADTPYYIGVVKKKASDNKEYGVNGQVITFTLNDLTNGYKIIDANLLSLKKDEGIPDPEILSILNLFNLPNGSVGSSYTAILSASGGAEPYSWEKVFGNLPPGLELNKGTGVISGTPTTKGMYNFTVRVTDNNGVYADKNFSILITYDIKDIVYGPQIRLSVFFQALLNTSTWSHSIPPVVRVEARTGNSPDMAKTLVGYADLILNENPGVNTLGRNGFLKPNGDEFPQNSPMPDGNYYLVIKQFLTPDLVGIGHLSVITNSPILLETKNDRDTSTTRLDLTADLNVTQALPNRIYKDTPYKPADKPDALFTFNQRTLMRAGDLNGNGYVDVIDTSHWYRLFTRFNTKAPDDPNDPYIRADLDQNGLIDVIDTSWWYGTFKTLTLDLKDPGPHGYVPPIQ